MSSELAYKTQLRDQFSRYSDPHNRHNLLESGAFDVATRIMKGAEVPLWMIEFSKKTLPREGDYFSCKVPLLDGNSIRVERELIKDPFNNTALVERVYSGAGNTMTLGRVTTVVKQISHGINGSGYYIFSQGQDEIQEGVPLKRGSIACDESYLRHALLTQSTPIRDLT
ncbi:MAG: hypothetical protein AAB546_04845 [Patescibacteria group bacterium]